MKTKFIPVLVTVMLWSISGHAQNFYYKTNNAVSLNQPASWTNNATPTANDWAVWDSKVATPANCTNNLGVSTNWGGIEILNPAAAVAITNVGATLSLGALGIDMNEASSTANLSINVPIGIVATQAWNVASGLTLTLNPGAGSPIQIPDDLAINGSGTVSIFAAKDFRLGGANLFLTNGNTTLDFSQNGASAVASLSVGYSGVGNSVNATVVQTAGVVKLDKNSTSTGCLLLGANGGAVPTTGTYFLNGGSLIDTTSTKADYFSIGDGAADTGILNVNGGSVNVPQIQIGNNGYGYVNVTNGTITTSGGDFLINKGTASIYGSLNVAGGTVSIPGHNLVVGNRGSASGNGASVTLSGSGIVDVGSSLEIPNTASSSGAQAPGIVTMNGGAMTVSNNVIFAGATFGIAGNVSGTLNLNGGTLTANGITVEDNGANNTVGVFNFNGGILRARENNGNFIAESNRLGTVLSANVQAGGAIIDDGGFSITINAPLLSAASPDGGLIKLDSGTLTLTGINTYNGPTVVGGGTLALATTNEAAGGVVLPGAATIDVTNGMLSVSLAAPGTMLICSNLAFGGAGGATALQFNISTNADPTVPLIYVTNNLSAIGNVTVNFNGANLSPGTIPLIQYNGSVSGGGTFSVGSLGWSGYIVNNTAAQQIQLVIESPLDLEWRALVNTNWDSVTANWYNTNTELAATYEDGSTIFFDDSTSNALVKLNGTVSPGPMTINNTLSNYVFSGSGTIAGGVTITKIGPGAVTMSVANSYNGGTLISNGLFTLGINNAIPAASDAIVQGTLDLAGFSTGVHSLNGTGIVNSSGAGAAVLTIGGNGGTFTGIITNTGASLALTKGGGNLFLLAPNNYYTGGTTNGAGQLELADAQSIGTGRLALNGGTLAWATSTPQTLTNPVIMGGNTVTFGSISNINGPLTITRTVDFGGSGHGINCYQNVLLAGGMTNGSLTSMGGSNTLTLLNTTDIWSSGSFSLSGGTMILTNSTVTEEFNNFRVQCSIPGFIADLTIDSGSSLILSNNAGGSDFRFGDTATGGGGATNELDLSGTLDLIPYPGANNAVQMGSSTDPSEYNILNLMSGGVLTTRIVRDLSPEATAIFNFNGGTLIASTNDDASTFMQGLTEANVLGGGAIINSAGYNIIIAQALLNDGVDQDGGLTKLGSGVLYLNGACTYTNSTLVSAGGLGGIGSLQSPVSIATGAGLYAGASSTNIGTFTINNTVTLAAGSSAVMKLDKLSGVTTNDNIVGITKLNYGGTLVAVTNFDMNSAFAIGDTFILFSATTYSGSFAGYQLPALPPGMGWNTSQLGVNGSISIVSVPVTPAVFKTFSLNGTNLVLSGSNGTAFGNYYVLTSTNLTLPLPEWTVIATNSFDGSGNFIFTNQINPATPERYFDISVP